MGKPSGVIKVEKRIYDDQNNPGISEYTRLVETTIPEAVIDFDTGKNILDIIKENGGGADSAPGIYITTPSTQISSAASTYTPLSTIIIPEGQTIKARDLVLCSYNGNLFQVMAVTSLNAELSFVICLKGADSNITIDEQMNPSSTNPLQNKAIYQIYLDLYSKADGATKSAEQLEEEFEDVKKSVSEGKSAIASTLTENGVSTAQDATFNTINTNVGALAERKYDEGFEAGKSESGGDIVDLPSPFEFCVAIPDIQSLKVLIKYSNTEFVDGVVIAYKTDDYPASPTDGTVIDTPGQPTSIIIDDLSNGATYYVRGFLYRQINDTKYYQTDRTTALSIVAVGTTKPTLQSLTWKQIEAISQVDNYSEYFSLDDTKQVMISTDEESTVTITFRIEDFDRDNLVSGGKAHITFGSLQIFTNSSVTSITSAQNVGWSGSDCRNYMSTLFHQLPIELQGIIKPVIKYSLKGTTMVGQRPAYDITEDRLWLFSNADIGSSGYPLLSSNSGRRRQQVDSSSYVGWWLRDAASGHINYYTYIGTDGSYSSNGTGGGNSLGIVFGFCI